MARVPRLADRPRRLGAADAAALAGPDGRRRRASAASTATTLIAHARGQRDGAGRRRRTPARTSPARLRADAAALRPHLALPLFCAAAHRFRGDDRRRLDALARHAAAPLLAAGGVRYHAPGTPAPGRCADRHPPRARTVDALGFAAEANAEAHLKPPAEMLRLFAGPRGRGGRTPCACVAGLPLLACDELRYEYPRRDPRPRPDARRRRWKRASPRRCARTLAGRRAARSCARLLDARARADRAARLRALFPDRARDRPLRARARASSARGAARPRIRRSATCSASPRSIPTKHDLLFERFVSAARNEPPDIDVDFEHERREEVIQHIYERYGRDRAAHRAPP